MYTKGEWRVSCKKNLYGDEYSAVNSGDEMIAVVSGFGHKANAQLIVSAPRMARFIGKIVEQDGWLNQDDFIEATKIVAEGK